MLAGRKVGQVIEIVSPVPVSERPAPASEKDAPLEVRVGVRVAKEAKIYRVVKVRLASYGVLDEAVIDFTGVRKRADLRSRGCTSWESVRAGSRTLERRSLKSSIRQVNQLVSTAEESRSHGNQRRQNYGS
jgi:hypothetical protein